MRPIFFKLKTITVLQPLLPSGQRNRFIFILWHPSVTVFSQKMTPSHDSSGVRVGCWRSGDSNTGPNSVERDYQWSSDQRQGGRRMMMVANLEGVTDGLTDVTEFCI